MRKIRFAKDIPKIWLIFARDMPEICLWYLWAIELCLRYVWDLPNMWLRYAWEIPEIRLRYDCDLPDFCQWYIRHISEIRLSYALCMYVCMYLFTFIISLQMQTLLSNERLYFREVQALIGLWAAIHFPRQVLKDFRVSSFLMSAGIWLYCLIALHLKLFIISSSSGVSLSCLNSILAACLVFLIYSLLNIL